MTELEKKAIFYAGEHCEDKDEDGFWLSDEEMLIRAFIAGAKAMQEDKERLETILSSMKEIVELLQQIERMRAKYANIDINDRSEK